MPIAGVSASNPAPKKTETVISYRISGDFRASGPVRIKRGGSIGGDLDMNGYDLFLEDGRISCDVENVDTLTMTGGSIGGDVSCNVFNQTRGRVSGDVDAGRIDFAAEVGGDVNLR